MDAPEGVEQWHNDSNNVVIVSVPDQDTLEDMMDAAFYKGLPYWPFAEPDLDGEHTACAFAPGEEASKLCANLPLALKGVMA